MQQRVYSVGKINTYIKNLISSDLILNNISVKGEVSNCKYNRSGHIYFSLKDETGVLSCVMFASQTGSLKFRLEDGMAVIACGKINVYEKAGTYQLYVNSVEKEGQGDLYRRFEELKERLAESGMFAEEYKRPIPEYSMNIGVVTAKTGAVINDIRKISKRRNPYVKITLYDAKVQGEGAAQQICAGIEALDVLGLDCIIIGRGGGSIEDLWAFNEEAVARAVFNCATPVISAVGHETDFTISDFAADLRAPTPSAAAELAVFDYYRFLEDLSTYKSTLDFRMKNSLERANDKTKNYKLMLDKLSPENAILSKRRDAAAYADSLEKYMENSLRKAKEPLIKAPDTLFHLMEKSLRDKKEQLIKTTGRLEGLSPLKRLSEGYAYVEDASGRAVKSIRQVEADDKININLHDGIITASAESITSAPVMN